MDRNTEIELLEELAELHETRNFYLDETIATVAVTRYTSEKRFERERKTLFHALPVIAAHCSELSGKDSFLTRDFAGLPLLLTRDSDNAVHAFFNVCRHRGTQLTDEKRGHRQRFTCPYHAWTYDNRGALRGIPHGAAGFPDLDRTSFGLKRLGCREAHGWIWVIPASDSAPDTEGFLEHLVEDFTWLDSGNLKVVHQDVTLLAANWKLLYEGALEAYHFRIAHKDTIGPYFQDNLSSYKVFGRHIRSVLPRVRLDAEINLPKEQWRLRRAANLVYSLFPSAQLLVQEDHIVWIQLSPIAPDQTRIRLSTLAPADSDVGDPATARHWRKNHDITLRTLKEDFRIGESIQNGLRSGANTKVHFGRFEGALARFNGFVDAALEATN